jgi:hypothetical protein
MPGFGILGLPGSLTLPGGFGGVGGLTGGSGFTFGTLVGLLVGSLVVGLPTGFLSKGSFGLGGDPAIGYFCFFAAFLNWGFTGGFTGGLPGGFSGLGLSTENGRSPDTGGLGAGGLPGGLIGGLTGGFTGGLEGRPGFTGMGRPGFAGSLTGVLGPSLSGRYILSVGFGVGFGFGGAGRTAFFIMSYFLYVCVGSNVIFLRRGCRRCK